MHPAVFTCRSLEDFSVNKKWALEFAIGVHLLLVSHQFTIELEGQSFQSQSNLEVGVNRCLLGGQVIMGFSVFGFVPVESCTRLGHLRIWND